MVVRQGDVYWAEFGDPSTGEGGMRRPVLIVQSDLFNETRLHTVVVASLTSNPQRRHLPGHVAIAKKQAGVPIACAVNLVQLSTLDKARLVGRMGQLSTQRMDEVHAALDLVLKGSVD